MRKHRRALASLILFLTLAPAVQAEVINRVVLRINDRITTLYDYQERRQEMAGRGVALCQLRIVHGASWCEGAGDSGGRFRPPLPRLCGAGQRQSKVNTSSPWRAGG